MITLTAKLNTHHDTFPRHWKQVWMFILLTMSGAVFWRPAASPEESVLHGHIDEYREILPFFSCYCTFPTWRKHGKGVVEEHEVPETIFRLSDCTGRSSREPMTTTSCSPSFFFTLSSSPDVPGKSSTMASHGLSCFLPLLTFLPGQVQLFSLKLYRIT